MSEPKQVIVMRKDLNMRRGKQIAQGAHASLKAILDYGSTTRSPIYGYFISLDTNVELREWVEGRFTKICVSVDSEEELIEIYNKAVTDPNIHCHALITDAGLTEFNGVPTKTCCAIGPADPDVINKITGHLKLL
jgi:PTH2 family peptidyl-tRNA hydrolase